MCCDAGRSLIPLGRREFRGATRAARRLDRDLTLAERTLLRGRCRSLFRLAQPNHRLHNEEHHQGDDKEVDQRVDERPIVMAAAPASRAAAAET